MKARPHLPTLARRRAGLEEALKRKDAIIRVRNAQISALWDELHTRQPWTNALAGDAPINLARLETANASRKLLVIGINTVRPTLTLAGLGYGVRQPINLARLETANASRKLLVIGINTVRAPHSSLRVRGVVTACHSC